MRSSAVLQPLTKHFKALDRDFIFNTLTRFRLNVTDPDSDATKPKPKCSFFLVIGLKPSAWCHETKAASGSIFFFRARSFCYEKLGAIFALKCEPCDISCMNIWIKLAFLHSVCSRTLWHGFYSRHISLCSWSGVDSGYHRKKIFFKMVGRLYNKLLHR